MRALRHLKGPAECFSAGGHEAAATFSTADEAASITLFLLESDNTACKATVKKRLKRPDGRNVSEYNGLGLRIGR